ncbi:MAG: hypothetical protein AAGA99_00655 [Actinomycetota bacterium]
MSGSALREKLEEALKSNRQLQQTVATNEAADLIREKGFGLVKPEDLVGVDVGDREAKAAELQSEREAAGAEFTRTLLAQKGLTEEQITDLLGDGSEGTGGVVPDPDEAAYRRAGAAGKVQGSPAPVVDDRNLHGFDAIHAGVKV